MSTKKFKANIPFWPAKTGNGFSVYIDSKVIETLSEVKEGGRLFLQEVTDAKSDNAPSYRITVFEPTNKDL